MGTQPRPNILLVTFDQWRADHLGALGCDLGITPNADALGAEGITFAQHFAQCAPCGPSRASLLTGRYLMNHRSTNNGTPLDHQIPNLAKELRAAGYDPTLFGYTDTTVDPRVVTNPDDPRLRTWEGIMDGFTVGVNVPAEATEWLQWLAEHGHTFDSVWHAMGVDGLPHPAAAHSTEPLPVPAALTQASFLTEKVIEHTTGRDEPWAAHVTYLSPHPPFVVPAEFHGFVDPDSTAAPVRRETIEDEGDLHPMLSTLLSLEGVRSAADLTEVASLRATYAAMVAEVDAAFGRLIDHLRATEQLDNTLIVLTSDHGEQLGDHWLMHKLGFFAESYHIPMIVRWPEGGFSGGKIEDRFTENIDIMPTILMAIGADLPEGLDGAPLQTLVAGAVPNWRTEVRWEWDIRDPEHHLPGVFLGLRLDQCALAVIRDRHTQYVHFSGAASKMAPLAFDLDTDPDCFVNRADDPAFAPRVLDAAQRMLTWRLQHQGGMLANTVVGSSGVHSRIDPPRP